MKGKEHRNDMNALYELRAPDVTDVWLNHLVVPIGNLVRLADDRESGDVVARCGTFAD
jgi:hypothetical protein